MLEDLLRTARRLNVVLVTASAAIVIMVLSRDNARLYRDARRDLVLLRQVHFEDVDGDPTTWIEWSLYLAGDVEEAASAVMAGLNFDDILSDEVDYLVEEQALRDSLRSIGQAPARRVTIEELRQYAFYNPALLKVAPDVESPIFFDTVVAQLSGALDAGRVNMPCRCELERLEFYYDDRRRDYFMRITSVAYAQGAWGTDDVV